MWIRSAFPSLLAGGLLMAVGGCSASLGIGDGGTSSGSGGVSSYSSSSTAAATPVDPIAAGIVPQGATLLASGNAEYSAFAPVDGTIYLYDVSTNRIALTEGVRAGNKIAIMPTSGGIDYSVTRSDGNETGTRSMPAGEHRLYFKSNGPNAPATTPPAKSQGSYY